MPGLQHEPRASRPSQASQYRNGCLSGNHSASPRLSPSSYEVGRWAFQRRVGFCPRSPAPVATAPPPRGDLTRAGGVCDMPHERVGWPCLAERRSPPRSAPERRDIRPGDRTLPCTRTRTAVRRRPTLAWSRDHIPGAHRPSGCAPAHIRHARRRRRAGSVEKPGQMPALLISPGRITAARQGHSGLPAQEHTRGRVSSFAFKSLRDIDHAPSKSPRVAARLHWRATMQNRSMGTKEDSSW